MHADDRYEDTARPQRQPAVPPGCRDVGGTMRYLRRHTRTGEWIFASDRMTYWRDGACQHAREDVRDVTLPAGAPPVWCCRRCGTRFYTAASLRMERLSRLRHTPPGERMAFVTAWGMTARDLRDAPAYVDLRVPVPKLPKNWRKP